MCARKTWGTFLQIHQIKETKKIWTYFYMFPDSNEWRVSHVWKSSYWSRQLYQKNPLISSCVVVHSQLEEIRNIGSLPCLEKLNLSGNPVCIFPDYRTKVLAQFGDRAAEVQRHHNQHTFNLKAPLAVTLHLLRSVETLLLLILLMLVLFFSTVCLCTSGLSRLQGDDREGAGHGRSPESYSESQRSQRQEEWRQRWRQEGTFCFTEQRNCHRVVENTVNVCM